MRHRLELQSATETLDADREAIQTWNPVTTLWANITPLGGSEGLSAREIRADARYQIEARYRAGTTPKMRGVGRNAPYTGVVFDFDSIQPIDGRTAGMLITATVRDV